MTGTISPTLPTIGNPNSTEDLNTRNSLITLRDAINALLTSSNAVDPSGFPNNSLAWSVLKGTGVQAQLGVNDGTTVSRGKSIIAATEARTNTAYGTLTTPDKVASVVLPTDGLIFVAYQATWQESVGGAARAAIFIGSNQLQVAHMKAAGTTPVPVTQAAATSAGGASLDFPLVSVPVGLVSVGTSTGAYSGDVTTGQAVGIVGGVGSRYLNYEIDGTVRQATPTADALPMGGACSVFAAAGTYDVTVQFKASSGSVTAKNRKLWVWTVGF